MDLITLTDYKQAKAISGSTNDERLGILIPAVSQLVKTYCGNSFNDYLVTGNVEYFSLDPNINTIQLREFPLIAVSELLERESETSEYVETTDFVLNRRTDSVIRLNGAFPAGIESVKITYTAGYTILPTDLQLAVIDLVQYYLKDEYKVSMSMQGSTISNNATSTKPGNIGFPDHIKRVLDMYKQL